MAISRTQKEAQVEALKEEFTQSSMTVMTAYSGLTVHEAQALRKQMRELGGNFRVVKNAMFKLAVADSFKDLDLSQLEGPIAVAFGYSDPVAPAKTISDYAKKHESLTPLGAFNAQGEWFDATQVAKLASLPSREQLTAQLVGTIAAPLSGFVSVLQGNLRGLVTVLDGVAQAKEA
ncbi:MAG: 50S ribosomal protein L10 [Candidatus Saccharimonadales bacterium]